MGYNRSWIWSHQARSQRRFGDCERVSSHDEYLMEEIMYCVSIEYAMYVEAGPLILKTA